MTVLLEYLKQNVGKEGGGGHGPPAPPPLTHTMKAIGHADSKNLLSSRVYSMVILASSDLGLA